MKLQKIPGGLLVFIGGGAGASARWWLTTLLPGTLWVNALAVTWAINLLGAFSLGFLLTRLNLTGSQPSASFPPQVLRLGLGTGFLGGFTTYSAFSVQAVGLLQDERWGGFFLYLLATLGLGGLACWGGMLLAEAITPSLLFHGKPHQMTKGDYS